MCFPYDQCMYCGTLCQNIESQGCMCCYCAFGEATDLYCDWCKPEEEEDQS